MNKTVTEENGIKIVRLHECMPDEEVDKLGGETLNDSHYDYLCDHDADVYTPEGDVLLKFRKGVIPKEMTDLTYPIWKKAATQTDNRGMASGKIEDLAVIRQGKAIETDGGGKRAVILKKDGTISNTTRAKSVLSGIVGFFDRSARFPYCRLTAFNLEHMDQFQACMPMIQLVDNKFKELCPERHKAQMEYHDATSKDFKIMGTSFTTITVNRNFVTAVHKDQGDLDEGFGVMSAIRRGKYKGGYTCWPKYGVAIDMQTTDMVCANVHHWHGNVPIKGIPGAYERISLVFYYRKGLRQCGTAEEELQRAIEKREAFYETKLA